jgi:hypothetical protein
MDLILSNPLLTEQGLIHIISNFETMKGKFLIGLKLHFALRTKKMLFNQLLNQRFALKRTIEINIMIRAWCINARMLGMMAIQRRVV